MRHLFALLAAALVVVGATAPTTKARAQTLTSSVTQCTTGQTCRPTLTWDSWPCTPVAIASPTGGGWTGTKTASGTLQVTAITATRTYTLSCDVAPATGSVTLTWTPPTTNTDGSPLTNLAGYVVWYGTTSTALNNSRAAPNPGLTSYVVDQLTAGTWYFAVSALNALGGSSEPSNIATRTLAPGTPTTITRSVTVTVGPAAPAPPAAPSDLQTGGTFTTELNERRYFIGDLIPLTVPAVATATRYEWEMTHTENRIVDTRSGTAASITWTPNRAGHYVLRVRACNADGCSPWLSNIDRGYLVHAWLRAPQF